MEWSGSDHGWRAGRAAAPSRRPPPHRICAALAVAGEYCQAPGHPARHDPLLAAGVHEEEIFLPVIEKAEVALGIDCRKASLRACERSTGRRLWCPLDGGRARAKRHGILSPAHSEPRMPAEVKQTLPVPSYGRASKSAARLWLQLKETLVQFPQHCTGDR